MPRIRTIKPTFFTSDDVSVLPLRARLTWIGLWTHCDDAGRAKDNVRLIKAAIWPLDDVSLAQVEEDLSTLADHGRIVRYEVDGQRFLEVTNWSEHQKISKATPSKIPGPYRKTPGTLPEDSRQEGKGKERKGREPPRTCEKHTGATNPPPCIPCKNARQAHEQWQADNRTRLAAAAKCRVHRGQLADNCALCRAEELNPA